jgi:hypothetical protein
MAKWFCEFEEVPAIGEMVFVKTQEYELIGVEPYVTRGGRETAVLTWRSHCAECGEPFVFKTGMRTESCSRRCKTHKAPLKPVEPRKPKKPKRLMALNKWAKAAGLFRYK